MRVDLSPTAKAALTRQRSVELRHKRALLDWLRVRRGFGQPSPTDRAIAGRLGLRTTDDALAVVQQLADEGAIAIERDGIFRHLVLLDPAPVAPAAAAPAPPVAGTARPVAAPEPRAVPPVPVCAAPATRAAAPPARPRKRAKHRISLDCSDNTFALLKRRAADAGVSPDAWALQALHAHLLETMPRRCGNDRKAAR